MRGAMSRSADAVNLVAAGRPVAGSPAVSLRDRGGTAPYRQDCARGNGRGGAAAIGQARRRIFSPHRHLGEPAMEFPSGFLGQTRFFGRPTIKMGTLQFVNSHHV
jgi:hypothetical protein